PDRIDADLGFRPFADFLRRTGYRLSQEAEWEYACRAGAATPLYYGTSAELLSRYAWHQSNSQDRTWPVGQKRPNDLGLFDMHGNVWTWVSDPGVLYPPGGGGRVVIDTATLYRGTILDVSDVKGSRVVRGGSFSDLPSVVR